MIFGLSTFNTIINKYWKFIMTLWLSCLNKYQLWNTKQLVKIKVPVSINRYWWLVVHGKISNKIPPLYKQKLSKNPQEKDNRIKIDLQTANRNYNGWKLQQHWNMLEWVNPRSKIVIKKPIQLFWKFWMEKDYLWIRK